jgi:hypothetical protein
VKIWVWRDGQRVAAEIDAAAEGLWLVPDEEEPDAERGGNEVDRTQALRGLQADRRD